jgi:two-component system sensor histidine kinase NblS
MVRLVSELGVGTTFWFDLLVDESALVKNEDGQATLKDEKLIMNSESN